MPVEKRIICPVCSSDKTKFCYFAFDILYKTVKEKFSIYKCAVCKALFIFPFPSREETKKFYPKNYYSYKARDETKKDKSFFSRIKSNIIRYYMEPECKLSFLDKLLVSLFKNKFSGIPLHRKKNGKFLDIGCGTGDNLEILNKYGWKAYGIEIDERAVEYARSKGLNATRNSIESCVFPNKMFDCIRIWHVFEHLTNPHSALQKLRHFLKDDGEILMAVPNTYSFAYKLFGRYWYNLDVPRHVVSYSPETLRYILQKNGLRCTHITYASCGSLVGSFSNFLRYHFCFKGNLINNIFLIFLFALFDFLSDILKRGDIIFLKIVKNEDTNN